MTDLVEHFKNYLSRFIEVGSAVRSFAAPRRGVGPMPAGGRKAAPKTKRIVKAKARYWSGQATRTSDALDLEPDVFTLGSPRAIAASLKRSAERSERRKGTPYQSAMSMLTFHINRAGKGLSKQRRAILEEAKQELRKAFGRA